jgi:hypothetical protein
MFIATAPSPRALHLADSTSNVVASFVLSKYNGRLMSLLWPTNVEVWKTSIPFVIWSGNPVSLLRTFDICTH